MAGRPLPGVGEGVTGAEEEVGVTLREPGLGQHREELGGKRLGTCLLDTGLGSPLPVDPAGTAHWPPGSSWACATLWPWNALSPGMCSSHPLVSAFKGHPLREPPLATGL